MGRTMYPTEFQLTANMARQQFSNSFTGLSGELGVGDRGAFNYIPTNTGNPYDSNDYIQRWRQYVHLYEISWEARKIVRIPVEDALRKPWIVEGIPEEMTTAINKKLNQLRFTQILGRSMMLERLLGGCLTFMGIEDSTDDTSKPYHPRTNGALKFMNAIPVSRINRINWDTNPLSENYMRPGMYMVNGENVHTSRCLVWDGEPLFDPYDFALTNFRSNLAGFGPSKLATVWDDIVKAVGTRQAAYQLIKTNNSIIAAVNDLQDLNGSTAGKEHATKLKEVANSLSLYRAALIDADKMSITQNAASFGSVPELIITFIQILSAASDIPATRFLGQAPGGLNATGESDLENYYNVIDALQRQRIEPQLRRVYDIIGHNLFRSKWTTVREDLEFKFPPLWNETEKEEAERNTLTIANTLTLLDAGLLGDKKAIDELNLKGVMSVELDETDLNIIDDIGSALDDNKRYVSPQAELQRLRNTLFVQNVEETARYISEAGGEPKAYDAMQFHKGFIVELEHRELTKGDPVATAKIVMDHLDEDPEYYTKLEKIENSTDLTRSMLTRDLNRLLKEMSTIDYDKNPKAWARKNNLAKKEFDRTRIQQSHGMDFHGYHDLWISDGRYSNKNFKWRPNPKEGEIESFDLHGMKMALENPKGSERSGVNPDGTEWSSILPAHYGYVKKTEGADGDEVDVYLGPHEESELVFVVDQNDADTGKFDEHKCIFGALGMTQAKELYLAGFSDGKGESRLGRVTPMHVSQFKQWLEEGDTKKPYSTEIKNA